MYVKYTKYLTRCKIGARVSNVNDHVDKTKEDLNFLPTEKGEIIISLC